MDDLIDALTILRKYGNERNPTHCSHDLMAITGIAPSKVTGEDTKRLEGLGFIVFDGDDCDDSYFGSFRFGSS